MPQRNSDDWQSQVFQALANSVRRAIVDECVTRQNQTLLEITANLKDTRQFRIGRREVSDHLSILVEAELIQETVGKPNRYNANLKPIAKLENAWLARYFNREMQP